MANFTVTSSNGAAAVGAGTSPTSGGRFVASRGYSEAIERRSTTGSLHSFRPSTTGLTAKPTK